MPTNERPPQAKCHDCKHLQVIDLIEGGITGICHTGTGTSRIPDRWDEKKKTIVLNVKACNRFEEQPATDK